MAFVTIRAIVQPPRTGHKQFIQQVNAVLDKFAQEAKQDLESPESTWKEHGTQFLIEPLATGITIGRSVYTLNEIYFYLNFGTRVRRALMSKDFAPKTRIRTLKSGAGVGGVVRISKQLELPGIKAREWTEVVRDLYQASFVSDMQKVASDSARH